MDLLLRVLLAAVVLFILGVIAWRDYKTEKIPDTLNLALLVCGAVAIIVNPETSLEERLIGFVAVSAPLLLVGLARRGSLGGGDIKLMAAAGFLLGWKAVIVAAGIGFLLAAVYAIYLMLVKKEKRSKHFPFGPALCIGIAIAYFFSPYIIGFLLA